MQSTLFPHDTVREQQDELIAGVFEAIDGQGRLVVHAPTGLGKTAAALAPSIERALPLGKIVIFLTSRLTQHTLALSTVARIQHKHKIHLPVIDLVGKKHLCLQPGVERLGGKEFAEYCANMREDGLCDFYTRLRDGEHSSSSARAALQELALHAPNTPEQVRRASSDQGVCPYEVTMLQAKEALVIITDYSYIFNEKIRDGFFRRINRELHDCILIVDEGHNLPERVKDLATERISTVTVRRAISELQRLRTEEHRHHLIELGELLERLAQGVETERYVGREELLAPLGEICAAEQLIKDLDVTAARVREEQKSSSCGTIADFLTAWAGQDESYTRILTVRQAKMDEEQRMLTEPQLHVELRYRCLDPALITAPILGGAYATVVMSGTLTPPDMYAKVLGIPDAVPLLLASPFPPKNRLNIIIPKTSTKYMTRSAQMYEEIAKICAQVVNAVPGNSALYFPSYLILEAVRKPLNACTQRTVFSEHPGLSKEEREQLLERYRQYKESGAVLLAVMGGSFSEGIDLPGDELRAVVVVGLPLARPDLETKALIEHYQQKFARGWEYGYTYPAFNKTLQSAGRCIRTETDRGAIIFLDERYAWQNYYACFPKDWHIKVTLRYEEVIKEFFLQEP